MKYEKLRSGYSKHGRFMLAAATAALIVLPGCSSTAVSGKPLAELSFGTVKPLYVSAANIDVINNYMPSADPQDVSSSMPTPPDIALRRWAERRLQAGPGTGTLKFVIESANVRRKHFGPQNTMQRWTGHGAHAQYDVTVKVSLGKETDAAMGGARHAMTVTRSVTVPDALSIAERETELQSFIEKLVADVDKAVTEVLTRDGLLQNAPAPMPLAIPSASAAPETGREQHQNGEYFQSPYNH